MHIQMVKSSSHKLANQNSEIESYKNTDLAIDLIQRAIANHQNISISGGATGALCVFPELGEYLDLLEDSAGFFTMPAEELQIEVIEAKEVTRLIETLKFGRDLDELL